MWCLASSVRSSLVECAWTRRGTCHQHLTYEVTYVSCVIGRSTSNNGTHCLSKSMKYWSRMRMSWGLTWSRNESSVTICWPSWDCKLRSIHKWYRTIMMKWQWYKMILRIWTNKHTSSSKRGETWISSLTTLNRHHELLTQSLKCSTHSWISIQNKRMRLIKWCENSRKRSKRLSDCSLELKRSNWPSWLSKYKGVWLRLIMRQRSRCTI